MKLIKLLKPVNKKEIMSLGIDPLLEKRYKNIQLFKEVGSDFRKGYLKYFTKDGVKYMKVGKTDYEETVDRIIRNHQAFVQGWDSWVETSMFEYFDTYTPGASFKNLRYKVDNWEKGLLNALKKYSSPADLPKMNGMSEIFVWTKQLDAIARNYINKNRYKG